MTDRVFLHLPDGWALAHDNQQWIVMKRKKRGDERYWNPVSFIGSTKAILERVLREKGAVITPETRAALDRLPGTFTEWRAQKDQLEAA